MSKEMSIEHLGKASEEWVDYFLSKLGAVYEFPFGIEVMVFKVRNKMFGFLMRYQGQLAMNIKCEPNHALELREVFSCVMPGYHMNKKHWNTILIDGSLPEGELQRQIDHSYDLVVSSLPKKLRQLLSVEHSTGA
ncbi:MmcQ/YjbR family DNA-binding protein [Marinomonas sp. 15G1-11]|uniref:MmcQ/YjbR family DNA-binding protein n=1 Tax=Marinomonas phaeophyticola TaxID=3004091 RepID=A0ABT4JVP1_9GAMM|nr:MmcQ/YjbR family DNA-binding protein [Marinomonas sp. 15G1-11]MCZ2722453.1 MmcQ/YjbR family DNA-binding protein [Marinomonas sp. 15G1-11]